MPIHLINANGTPLAVGDPTSLIKFKLIKAKALKARTYGGKSLKLGGGGRWKMLTDELQLKGYSSETASQIAAKQAILKYGKVPRHPGT